MASFARISFFIVLVTVALTGFNFVRADEPGDTSWSERPFPLVDVQADTFTRVVNLTQGSATDALTPEGDGGAGYSYTRYKHLDVEGGFGPQWFLATDNIAAELFGTGAGLMPVYDKTAVISRFAKNHESLKSLDATKIPRTRADFQGWTVHDSIAYQTNGGVLFLAWAGYAGTAVTASYFASGLWSTYVEKVGDNQAYVKITKGKLDSLKVRVGNEFIYAEKSKFKEADHGFSFTFNLADPQGLAAYQDMLKGNVAASQQMAQGQNGAVQEDLTQKWWFAGTWSHIWFGVPMLLNTRIDTGKIYNITDTLDHRDGTQSHVEYGLYLHEKSNRALLHETGSQLTAFYGVSDTRSSGASEDVYGNLYFEFTKRQAKGSDIAGALKKLAKQTGLTHELNMAVPNGDHLGYAEVDMTMTIPQSATESLMAKATDPQAAKTFEAAAARAIDGLCQNESDAQACRAGATDQTSQAADGMVKSLRLMKQFKGINKKEFVKAYAAFGKAFLTNQFTFQTLLAMTAQTPVEIQLTIDGEKIAIFNKTISAQPSQRSSDLFFREALSETLLSPDSSTGS